MVIHNLQLKTEVANYGFQVVNAIEEPLSDVVTSDPFAPFENKFIKLKL